MSVCQIVKKPAFMAQSGRASKRLFYLTIENTDPKEVRAKIRRKQAQFRVFCGYDPNPPLKQRRLSATPAASLIGGLLGGLLGSFFSKRGEISAIQSKISTVVSQNERLVRSSEEIKTELSKKAWSKQRNWDLKRDTALDVMRVFGELQQL